MSTNIDTLQIEIEASSEKAKKGLDSLTDTLSKLDKVAKSSGLEKLTKTLDKLSKIDFSNMKSMNNVRKTMKSVNDSLSSVQKNISAVSSSMNGIVDNQGLNNATSEIQNMSDTLNSVPKQIGVKVDSAGASEMSTSADNLADNLIRTTSAADVLKMKLDGVKEKLSTVLSTPGYDKSAAASLISQAHKLQAQLNGVSASSSTTSGFLKKMTSTLHSASSAFKRTTKKASELSQILKIVVVYGGAFRAFMLLTQGVSEGLQNVAQYNEETAAAMNRLSTMSLYLKNSIGAALYPVIVALTPALQAMTNAIVRAFEAMGQLVSLLSGKTTYLKAKEYLKSYVDTAKGAANQIKKSFAGMDEITVIGQKDSGSSGGGGGEDYGSMFEEVPIDNPKLQALLPFFQGLGTVLSSCFETIKGLANDYLYPWLVNLGNWCKENPDSLETIGKGLGYIVVGLTGISALKGVAGILTTLLSPITALCKALSNLGVFKGIGTFFKALGSVFTNVASGTMSLGAAIKTAFAGSTGILGGVALAIAGLIGYVANLVDMFKEGESWSNILGAALGGLGAAGGAFLIAIGAGAAVATGGWAALVVGIIAAVGIITALVYNHWDEISAFFVSTWETIAGFFSGVAAWVNNNILQPIVQFFTPFVEAVCGFFGSIWSVASSIFNGIRDCVVSVFTAVYEVIANVVGNIVSIISGIAVAVWSVVTKIAEIVKTIGEVVWAVISYVVKIVWDNCLKPIVDFVSSIVTTIVEKLTSIVNKVKVNVIDPVVNFFKNMVDKISGFFKNIAISVSNAVSSTFKSVLNGAFTLVENVVNFFIKGLNGAIGVINKIPGVNISKVEVLSIPRFKDGGFPDGEDGLFFANHSEMIGKFSNGKTAVANNDQIVDGISDGVYSANQEQNRILLQILQEVRNSNSGSTRCDVNISTITRAAKRQNRRAGTTIIPLGV